MRLKDTKGTLLEDLGIYTYDQGELTISHQISPGYESYVLPGSVLYTASGYPGTMLFQEFPFSEYTIWISHYFTHKAGKVTGRHPGHSLEVHFMLQNDLIYKLQGFSWQSLKETQYNLLALPVIKSEVYFSEKNYWTFDVHPSLALLEKIASRHRPLQAFLLRVKEGQAVQLFKRHPYASAGALYLIRQIIAQLQTGHASPRETDRLVETLLRQVLIRPLPPSGPHFRYFDIEKLYEAEHRMIQYMDEEDILDRQIQKTRMRKSRFREAFVQIFGKQPHLYLLDKRMEMAQDLLRSNPELKIKDISRQVGYPNPNNFSVAYKKKFGISPRQDRQRLSR